ncbi:hypothetical protein BC830DRAFT_827102 [Chytriomyces sp. MP71]|nr:hypothetical protein BC830DRAFT_827102 [Chytriomyces sp. MP71]
MLQAVEMSNPSTRLFLGFGDASVDEAAIRNLFGSVGEVLDVSLNTPKRCAHVTISDLDIAAKCVKTFNKTKWRGAQLRVEPAQPHFTERLAKEIAAAKLVNTLKCDINLSKNQARRMKRLARSAPVLLDKDISNPVTENNWVQRKESGWKLIKKLNRPVLVMKIKMSRDAKKATKIDPTKYHNKVQKLFPHAYIPEPSVTQLHWPGIDFNPTFAMKAMLEPLKPASSSDNIAPIDNISQVTRWPSRSGTDVVPAPNSGKRWIPSFLDSDNESYGDHMSDQESSKSQSDGIDVPADLNVEREKSMGILRDLLGMKTPSAEGRTLHAPVIWRETVRFDPVADGAETLLREDDQIDAEMFDRSISTIAFSGLHNENFTLDQSLETMRSVQPMASYIVNTNLRSLVFGEEEKPSKGGQAAVGGLFSWVAETPQDKEPSGPGLQGDAIREKAGGIIKSSEKFSLLGALGIKDEGEDTDHVSK